MICRAIIAFFSGGIDSEIPEFALLIVSVFGTAAVGWGIVREAKEIWSLTTALVLGGVAVEAICTFLLFGFDDGIIRKQKDEIIGLSKEIAPRRFSVDEAKEFGDTVGKFVLDESTKAALVNGDGQFSLPGNRSFLFPFVRVVKLESYTLDPESAAFGHQLLVQFASLKYVVVENALLTNTPFQVVETGIHVYGVDNELAAAIASAIPKRFGPTTDPPTLGGASLNVSTSDIAPSVTIFVGAKPLPKPYAEDEP